MKQTSILLAVIVALSGCATSQESSQYSVNQRKALGFCQGKTDEQLTAPSVSLMSLEERQAYVFCISQNLSKTEASAILGVKR